GGSLPTALGTALAAQLTLQPGLVMWITIQPLSRGPYMSRFQGARLTARDSVATSFHVPPGVWSAEGRGWIRDHADGAGSRPHGWRHLVRAFTLARRSRKRRRTGTAVPLE